VRVVSLLRWREGSLRLRRLVTVLVLVLVLRELIIRLGNLLLRAGLLVLVLRLGSWHMHTLLLSLVSLRDRAL
jgi:hypothetical protein